MNVLGIELEIDETCDTLLLSVLITSMSKYPARSHHYGQIPEMNS